MKRLILAAAFCLTAQAARAEFSVTVDLGPACQMTFGNPQVAEGFLRLMQGKSHPETWMALVRKIEPEHWDIALRLISSCGGWGT